MPQQFISRENFMLSYVQQEKMQFLVILNLLERQI